MKRLLLCLTLASCAPFGGTDASAPEPTDAPIVGSEAGIETDSSAPDGGATDSGSDSSIQDAGCATVTHSAGGDAGWVDCTPVGTRTQEQAMAACKAWSAGQYGCTVMPGTCASQLSQVVRTATAAPRAWAWPSGAITQDDGTGVCHPDGTWQ